MSADDAREPGQAPAGSAEPCAAADPEQPLTRYASRQDVPRDLRTAAELEGHGYSQLGPARAELVLQGVTALLYSTSEARLLKHSLWPRGPKLQRAAGSDQSKLEGAEGQAGHAHLFGGPRRVANPGGTSEVKPGQARRDKPWSGATHTSHHAGTPAGRHAWASQLFGDGFVVLDTETTGLGRGAEIIEIAVLDSTGEALLETRVWPRSGRVPQESTRVHGLTLTDLHGAPTWPEVLLELERKLAGRRVLAWNAPFDERMARQTSRAWSLVPRLPAFECAMRGYAHARGIASLSMRLERAAQVERVLTTPQQHRSLGDTELVLAVLKRLLQAGTVPA